MSREFKFRVWEPLNKNMHFLNFALYENKGHVNNWVLPLNHQCCSDKNYTIMNLNNVEIMQYTGLKDVNGKEVYEGDIILSPWWDDEPQEVVFHKYGFKVLDIRQKIVHGRELYEGIDDLLDGCFGKDFEILGNIYENPELLEGER